MTQLMSLTLKTLPCVLFLFCGKALCATCTHSDVQIAIPPLLIGTSDAPLPLMISSAWHEAGGAITACTGYPDKFDFYTLANNTAPRSTQKLVFEGATYDIYLSNIKGVGVIMSAADASQPYKPFTSSEIIMSRASTATSIPGGNSKYRVRFVATERLPAGLISLPSFQVMRHGLFMDGYYGWGKITAKSTTINIKYPTCQLKTPAMVKLPMVTTRDLEKAGSTAGETAFTIGLNCGAGVTAMMVKYTITDAFFPANTTSTLNPEQSTTTTSGLAMQILENGTPINFGPDSSAAGTLNQKEFGKLTSAGGQLSKAFIARYLRTPSTLIPGKINTGMTITMSYQ